MSRREGHLSDERIQDKLRVKEKVEQEQRNSDVAAVMATGAGRRVFYDLIFNRCNLMAFYGLSDSGIYRHEGRRQLGVEIAQELQEHHTEAYILMVTERLHDQQKVQQTRDAALTPSSGDDDATP